MTSRIEVDFDHHSADYARDSSRINDDLVARCPVAWSSHHDGFWVVSDYADVATVARDDATYSSAHDTTGDEHGYGGIAIPEAPVRSVPIELDPPVFLEYRRILNPYFSPKVAATWRPFLDGLTDECLDAICDAGSGDLLADLANPMPAKFTLALMGLPLDDWQKWADPAHRYVATPSTSEDFGEVVMSTLGLVNLLSAEVEDRKANPRQDLISHLCQAKVDGEPLSVQLVVEICFLLVFGGVDTTTGLTANALVWLADRPDERARLVAEPELMNTAIEEWLRYFTPVQTMARTVTGTTELGGQCLAAGERLLMNFAAANRDPEQFQDPGEVDLERRPNRHASFGLGIHRCLGSNYARAMIASMVGGVLRRMPDYAVDLDAARRYTTIGQVNGWDSLPISFSASPPLSQPVPEPPAFQARG